MHFNFDPKSGKVFKNIKFAYFCIKFATYLCRISILTLNMAKSCKVLQSPQMKSTYLILMALKLKSNVCISFNLKLFELFR